MRSILFGFSLLICGAPVAQGSPIIECHNTKQPDFRFELEAPPPSRALGRDVYQRKIRFWEGSTLIGEDRVKVGVARHSTRVEVGEEIDVRGQRGFSFELLDIGYSSSPQRVPVGFTGVFVAMGARVGMSCRRL